MKKLLSTSLILFSLVSLANFDPVDFEEDELNIGGDIFTDFNEDLENTQVVEDERFYKYGRLFSFQLGLGMTSFTGNRGQAYTNQHPSFGLGVNYFLDFQSSFGLGVEFSEHTLESLEQTAGSGPQGFGLIEVNMLRINFNWRYYIDTSDLGTALTYANPYFTARLEYWYTVNKYVERDELANNSGGGLGAGLGGGFDFPIRLRESYVNVELLWHRVNFDDKYTDDYAVINSENQIVGGYGDLTGDVITFFASYVFSW